MSMAASHNGSSYWGKRWSRGSAWAAAASGEAAAATAAAAGVRAAAGRARGTGWARWARMQAQQAQRGWGMRLHSQARKEKARQRQRGLAPQARGTGRRPLPGRETARRGLAGKARGTAMAWLHGKKGGRAGHAFNAHACPELLFTLQLHLVTWHEATAPPCRMQRTRLARHPCHSSIVHATAPTLHQRSACSQLQQLTRHVGPIVVLQDRLGAGAEQAGSAVENGWG